MEIAGISKKRYGVTRGPRWATYDYAPFPKTVTFTDIDRETKLRVQKSVDVKSEIDKAWSFIAKKSANHDACNQYFSKLPGKKSLKRLLAGRIVLYQLRPRAGKTDADLPRGASGGGSIGINLTLIARQNTAELSATLIHELAHLGGAQKGGKSLDAETALKHCLLPKHFDPRAVGVLQQRGLESATRSRLA